MKTIIIEVSSFYKMIKRLCFCFLVCSPLLLFSQNLNPKKANLLSLPANTIAKDDLQKLKLLQDTLKGLSEVLTYDTSLTKRKEACYSFIPRLVRALKFDNSFYFAFDSLEPITRIYSPDSLFRIFTWQLALPQGRFRYYGVIQMRSLKTKIFPLVDLSDTMQYHPQHVVGNNNWYGALYYNIISKQINKKTVYTLFGFEAADVITRRKVIDILSFDSKGEPRFGAPLFYFKLDEDSTRYKKTDTLSRFFIEYKYNAPTVMNYDKQMDLIVLDHVVPPNEKAKGATFSYVPDGTYEGFEWKNDRWNWVEKVFTFSIGEGDNPPIPAPLFGEPTRQPVLPK